MKKSLYFIILTMFFIPFLSTPKSYSEEMSLKPLENNTSYKIDTSNWITHPVGRYLIKLPPTAQIKLSSLRHYDNQLKWEENLSINEANQLLNEKYLRLKANKNLIVAYKKNFGADRLGSLLKFADKNAPDGGVPSISYKMFVVSNKTANSSYIQRVFSYEATTLGGFEASLAYTDEEVLQLQKESEAFIYHVAENIWTTDKTLPVENRTGTYFDGGFLYIPDRIASANEQVFLKATFLEYPNIEFYLSFEHMPFVFADDFELNTTIANISANEMLGAFMNNNVKNYLFHLATPSPTHDFEKPYISMHLKTKGVYVSFGTNKVAEAPNLAHPSFSSDEEALAFWNAIKENILWRPTEEF